MNFQERLFRQTHGYACEPATILAVSSLAISAAGATATAQGQNAAATQTKNYQNDLVKANNSQVGEQTSAVRLQQAQSAESQAREMEKARLATQRAQGSATVAAGQAGVSGHSVDAVLAEYQTQLGQYREATLRQGVLNATASTEQVKAIETNAKYSNLQIKTPVSGANYAALALGVAKDAVGVYGAYNPGAFKASPTPGKG